jgi:hypothetical protein
MRSLTAFALGALAFALVHAPVARGQGAPSGEPKRAPLASPADVEPAVDVGGTRVALIDGPPAAAPPAPTASAFPAPPQPTSAPGVAAQKSSGSAPGSAPKSSAVQPKPSAAQPKPSAAPLNPSAAQPNPSAAQPSAASTPPKAPAPNSRAMDTLDLGTTSITGNQELPKVLYIVPWKKSDLGDLVGRPVNTLLDEVLEPVDPEVFQRHLSYYDALYGKGQKGKE